MIKGKNYTVHIGSNLDILPTLESNSVDSIVTDPPYELGFMGKKWDSSGIAYNVELWRECLRVLKPGGHMLAFGGSRTWHRIAVAIEDAGFEVRDSIAWMYGSGFPKSLDISKAIDKVAGAERNKVLPQGSTKCADYPNACSGHNETGKFSPTVHALPTAPATPEAKQWEGWGTALKPAFEPVIVARKPLIGTVAENVLTYGTGGLNIDGSRIGITVETWPATRNYSAREMSRPGSTQSADAETQSTGPAPAGRWPANVILDPYTAELLDEQSGISTSRAGLMSNPNFKGFLGTDSTDRSPAKLQGHNDSGGASRFFYVAKASKRDRNEGLEELPLIKGGAMSGAEYREGKPTNHPERQNFHPTVKPTTLMEYLIKLVTPPNGLVLDPFTGSGSTGKAALLNGFRFVGCELTEDYIPIIKGRLNHAEAMAEQAKEKEDEALF